MSMLPENANQTIERQLGPPRQKVQVLHPMSQIKPAGRPAWPLRLRSLYPAGKRLSPAEVKRSIAHAPQCQKTKKPICWDAACHIGCQRSSCPHAHEPLPSLSRLDYTVAMQVLRRGGLKNGPKVNPKDVDGRVAQLRAQAKEEQASKVDPGDTARGKAKAKAKAKEKAGWSRNKRCRSGKEVRRVEVRRYTCLSLHGPRRCPQKGKGDVGVPPCSSATQQHAKPFVHEGRLCRNGRRRPIWALRPLDPPQAIPPLKAMMMTWIWMKTSWRRWRRSREAHART